MLAKQSLQHISQKAIIGHLVSIFIFTEDIPDKLSLGKTGQKADHFAQHDQSKYWIKYRPECRKRRKVL